MNSFDWWSGVFDTEELAATLTSYQIYPRQRKWRLILIFNKYEDSFDRDTWYEIYNLDSTKSAENLVFHQVVMTVMSLSLANSVFYLIDSFHKAIAL